MRLLLLVSALTLAFNSATAQGEYAVPKLEDLVKVPNSPEAQAFSRYGNTQVNLYTGTPDISIPLTTLQGRELSIPLVLTYDASGIKVDQIATSAGLGWNLKGGGMISRQTRGNPDDFISASPDYLPFYVESVKDEYAFVNDFSPAEYTNYPPGDLERYFEFLRKSLAPEFEKIEIQPDVYSFSALGIAGTIFIDYDLSVGRCMEHPELKIIPIFNENSFPIKVIDEWRITDASGNVYYFGFPETTNVLENNSFDGYKNYYSGWSLYKVESANKRDTVEFSYSQETWTQPQEIGTADYRLDAVAHNTACGGDQLVQPTLSAPTYRITQSAISTITLNGKLMAEITGASRLDLAGRSRVNEVKIYGHYGEQISRYKLIHTYFGPTMFAHEREIRLRLDAVEIYGDTTSTEPLKYQFEYDQSAGLPPRNSLARDFWGYHNGWSNATLIPYNYDYDKANLSYYGWRGGNRMPDLLQAKAGSLISIRYPTGGTTEFTYQLHRSADISYIHKEDVSVGGVGCLGGTQSTNPYNYTDDMIPTPPYPKGNDAAFNVTISGYYEVRYSLNVAEGTQAANPMQYVGLYRSGDVNCDSNGNCDFGEARTFSDLFSSIQPIFYGGVFAPFSFATETIWLESGAYRLLAMNNDPNSLLNVEVWGSPSTVSHDAGGLRITKITDKDESGIPASTRYFYYGDLSSVSPAAIDEDFLANSNLSSGTLHDVLKFEDTRATDQLDYVSSLPTMITCYNATRYSSNRWQSDFHVTYPVVTEVQFDNVNNLFNGFTVFEFFDQASRYADGFAKASDLNGKTKSERRYNSSGELLSLQQNHLTVRSTGYGVNRFSLQGDGSGKQDLYVRYPTGSPGIESYEWMDAPATYSGGSLQSSHCSLNGNSVAYFGSESDADNYVSSHPGAVKSDESTPIGFSPPRELWVVTIPAFTIVYCHDFGAVFTKQSYNFPVNYVTEDSVVQVTYASSGTLSTSTKKYYENINHYQVTRMEQKDSKGILTTLKQFYPHELSIDEPGNSIWTTLIAENRINLVIKKEASFAVNQPDYLQKTGYKTINTGTVSMIVPDKIQIASGTGPLEDRIQFHVYDSMGNVAEVSRTNDVHESYLWGYDKTLIVAQAGNARVNEIFYTSFEGDEGGNSLDQDAWSGRTSKIGGYSKLLSGLTVNKDYVLTYWVKSGSDWDLQTINIPSSASSSYTINLTGQIDEVRFCPKGSLMTTYTYRLAIGVDTKTDFNNRIMKYEYDDHGRLTSIRDHDNNILKHFKYHFQSGPKNPNQSGSY